MRSANNVELDRDARAPLLAFSNSLSLSQIHFQLSGDHFHFFFFKSTFACKKFIFSNWPHYLRRRGADSFGNPTYMQFMPFEHLA